MLNDHETFGGEFDGARDSEEKIRNLVTDKPDYVWAAEVDGQLVGTVTVFEDGRACWLYRFAYRDRQVGQALWDQARQVAADRGHSQVLVYAPAGDTEFEKRYNDLGFNTGHSFTAYWQDI